MLRYGLHLCFIFVLTVLSSSAHAAPHEVRLAQTLETDWRFVRVDVARAQDADFDDSGWQKISLPHSFNAEGDGADSTHYYRGIAWYRHGFHVDAQSLTGKQTFIEFDGALLSTEVWVNGQKVGLHEGGYARFRFNITPYLKRGHNVLAVKVDNQRNDAVAPLSGDFTQFGGLYRPVRLITTEDVHFDMLDYGGAGVYISQHQVNAQSAQINTRLRLSNDGDLARQVIVKLKLIDASGKTVTTSRQSVVVDAKTTTSVDLNNSVTQPHLWQGVTDPYLYTVHVVIESQDKTIYDQQSIKIGFRDIRIDANEGLLLNGKPYAVYGPNVHLSMRPKKAVAVSKADIDEDFQIWRDMGATGLRLAHYQHDQRDYELADKYGLLIWTEIPLVSEIKGSDAFIANASDQLKELIRQNFNHPSVFVWGLGNEIYNANEDAAKVLSTMQTLAHTEDSSRPTVYANCCIPIDHSQAKHTDVIASNIYLGWYDGEFNDLGPWLDKNHTLRPTTAQGISEYGAGASIIHQDDPPRRPKTTDRWHPEQYQALYHEAAWRQLRERPWLWSRFIWVGFDFPSMGRNEGDRKGFNDKGLVTFDRKTRKDAYFWYQANWSSKPMVYITSRRFNVRSKPDVEIKVYTNEPEVVLTLNGKALAPQKTNDHIALFNVSLVQGRNRIEVKTKNAQDSVEWIYQPR